MNEQTVKSLVPHEVEWTSEKVSRFWDYQSTNQKSQEAYFTRMVGSSLLRLVKKHITVGTAADIGSGPGDFAMLLIDGGHEVYAADSSPTSIASLKERVGDSQRLKAAEVSSEGTGLPDAIADTAFLIEVVEHLDDRALIDVVTEAGRVLKKGGHLVLTTPNEENLDASKVVCPDCWCVFHKVQHVRQWSAETLSAAMSQFGFTEVACYGTILAPYKGLKGALYGWAYPKIRRRYPHLIYIGRKR